MDELTGDQLAAGDLLAARVRTEAPVRAFRSAGAPVGPPMGLADFGQMMDLQLEAATDADVLDPSGFRADRAATRQSTQDVFQVGVKQEEGIDLFQAVDAHTGGLLSASRGRSVRDESPIVFPDGSRGPRTARGQRARARRHEKARLARNVLQLSAINPMPAKETPYLKGHRNPDERKRARAAKDRAMNDAFLGGMQHALVGNHDEARRVLSQYGMPDAPLEMS